jgi:hypothetical protein
MISENAIQRHGHLTQDTDQSNEQSRDTGTIDTRHRSEISKTKTTQHNIEN